MGADGSINLGQTNKISLFAVALKPFVQTQLLQTKGDRRN